MDDIKVDADQVFKESDFQSIKLKIRFKNFTTKTEVSEEALDFCELLELGERTLILQLPARCCNLQHAVAVTIFNVQPKTHKETELLGVTGKVTSLEAVDKETSRVSVECVQFDEQSWIAFVKLFSSRQEEIMRFFEQIKG